MEINPRKNRNKYDEIKGLKKRRDRNLEKVIQDKMEIDSPLNRKMGVIPPGRPSPFEVAKCGVLLKRIGRYLVFVPFNHYYSKKYGLQGWEYRHRLVWLIYSGKRSIPAFHDIHHDNHDITDDNPRNLYCVDIREHQKRHFLSKKEKEEMKNVRIIEANHYIVARAHEDNHPKLIRLSTEKLRELGRRAEISGVARTRLLAEEVALQMNMTVEEVVQLLSDKKKVA